MKGSGERIPLWALSKDSGTMDWSLAVGKHPWEAGTRWLLSTGTQAHGSLCPFPQRAYGEPLCNQSTAGRGQPGRRGRQVPSTTLVPMIHSPVLQFSSFFPFLMSSLQLS